LEEAIREKERELMEREKRVEEQERAVQEMQRLKKNSSGDGSSTTNPGTDLGNDSCIKTSHLIQKHAAGPIFN